MASRESVRGWFHKFSKIFSVEKKFRMLWLLIKLWLSFTGPVNFRPFLSPL
jgi:hypothetical protein